MLIVERRRVVTTTLDPDVQAWVTAVETADGATLATGYRDAMNNLVLGLKTDGSWNSIRQILPLSSAATLAGALVALKGPAASNNGSVLFIAADYSRSLGLLGKANAQIDTNILQNDSGTPLNNMFAATHLSVATTTAMLGGTSNAAGCTRMHGGGNNTSVQTVASLTAQTLTAGFNMIWRINSTQTNLRTNSTNYTYTLASDTSRPSIDFIWNRYPTQYGTSRYRLCMLGSMTGVDPAQLQARCDAYVAAITAL